MSETPLFATVVPLAKVRLPRASAGYSPTSAESGYTYRIPPDLTVTRGQEVRIQLGSREERGIVLKIEPTTNVPSGRLKELAKGKAPFGLSEASLNVAAWIAQEELCTYGQALELFLPPSAGVRKKKTEEIEEDFLPAEEQKDTQEQTGRALTQEQSAALELCRSGASPLLMWGVTGSGKTEVYFRRIAQILKADPQAQILLLVPEIGMIPQMENRARAYFSAMLSTEESIAVIHSKCSSGERTVTCTTVANGTCRLLIGTRSALFAPFVHLKLLVLDECHDDSYASWDLSPRYDGRAVAEQLARLHDAQLIYGSATPHVEAIARSQGPDADMHVMRLQKRIHQEAFPSVRIVDMRTASRAGQMGVLSWELQEALTETLTAGRQAILFLNRRGAATAVTCSACGWTATCKRCEIPLVHHLAKAKDARQANVLICHHCNHHETPPITCPDCAVSPLRYAGAGTERVELELRALLPDARIARMDADTTARKGSHKDLYDALRNREIDILVGTQIVTKGLDLPAVDVVGIVQADTLLSLPDFRSNERTFQLLSQVVGRTGRRDNPGKVILQTYAPEHPVIQAVATHDADTFFATELQERKTWGYPPFGLFARILCEHTDTAKAVKQANAVAHHLRESLKMVEGSDVLGPAPAFHARLHGRTRIHLLVKAPKEAKTKLWEVLSTLPDGVKIDTHPLSTL